MFMSHLHVICTQSPGLAGPGATMVVLRCCPLPSFAPRVMSQHGWQCIFHAYTFTIIYYHPSNHSTHSFVTYMHTWKSSFSCIPIQHSQCTQYPKETFPEHISVHSMLFHLISTHHIVSFDFQPVHRPLHASPNSGRFVLCVWRLSTFMTSHFVHMTCAYAIPFSSMSSAFSTLCLRVTTFNGLLWVWCWGCEIHEIRNTEKCVFLDFHHEYLESSEFQDIRR